MTLDKDQIVNKIRSLCHVLRHDWVSVWDYLEQLTFLIFLKMAFEKTKAPFNKEDMVPSWYWWQDIISLDGDELEIQYRATLQHLAKQSWMLWMIFRKSQNKINEPASLKRVINEIDKIDWNILGVDVKWEIYEWLLWKVAEDTKSWAWQYFTPRPLIDAIVEVMQPNISTSVFDPAAGTWWFLLSAHEYILKHNQLDRDQQKALKTTLITGNELVPWTARLAVMNMFLHGIWESESPISVGDSLISAWSKRYSMVLTNPPFGNKSSHKIIDTEWKVSTESNDILRDDFWTTTSNKQLNFVQHIHTILETDGTAAIILPDNVLFEWGSWEVIRKKLLAQTNLHTILRLPTWLFYAQGVKANVLFLQKKRWWEDHHTKEVWFYDLRTNMKFTLKKNPLQVKDLEEFIECYKPWKLSKREETWSEENPEGRWKKYSYDDIIKRDKTSLDIFWLKDQSLLDTENLDDPDVIASEIMEQLEFAIEQFRLVESDIASD